MDFRSRERFVSLLTCTVGQMCKSGFIDSELFVSRIDGLLGITLSNSEVFLINICECFHSSDSFGNSAKDHITKISTKTSAASSLTQSSVPGRAGQATAVESAKKVQTISKQTTSQVASFTNSCMNASFQAQSAGEAIINSSNDSRQGVQLPNATVDTNIVAYYSSAPQNEDLMCTFIKVEENSNDGLQVINSFSRDCLQEPDELNFASSEKLSTSLLEKQEPMEENSAMLNQLCYADDDSSYITSSSFADPGYGDHTSVSQDFFPTDPTISYNSYSQPLHPLSSSSKVTTAHQNTLPAIPSSKQQSVWQRKRIAPHSQTRKVEPRKKWKHRYDATTLKECIELVRSYKMSQREAERVFQIPRTTIQMKLAQMYPMWVAPPRQTFAKRNTFTAVNPSTVSDPCHVGAVKIKGESRVETT